MRSDKTDRTDQMVADLLEAARPPYAARARALSTMAGSRTEQPARAVTRRASWILRGAAAAVVVALALGLVVIPGRHGKRDVQAILAGVAHAMASADSVLMEYRRTQAYRRWSTDTRPGAAPRLAQLIAFYLSREAIYERATGPDDTVLRASGLDLGKRQWWFYSSDRGALHVADLTPIEAEAADFLAEGVDYILYSGEWQQLLGNESLADPEAEVATRTRDGREITVLTFTGWLPVSPVTRSEGRASVRNVFEIDAETNRLLSARYYHQPQGQAEELMAVIDTVRYNVAVPDSLTAAPDAAEIVHATAVMEDYGDGQGLVMKAAGETVHRIDVPKHWRGEREGAESRTGALAREAAECTANMKELSIALQSYALDQGDTFPPVDNVYDLMPLLDAYLRSRHVFMRPGTEDEVVVQYLVPPGLRLAQVWDAASMPVAVADYHPDFAVVAYADGHAAASDKKSPSYKDRWWEDWWREFERKP